MLRASSAPVRRCGVRRPCRQELPLPEKSPCRLLYGYLFSARLRRGAVRSLHFCAQKTAMKQTDAQKAEQTAAGQQQSMQVPTVTQISPDDELLAGGPITPADEDGTPTQRQVEQDVITVNPSIDSMESRG